MSSTTLLRTLVQHTQVPPFSWFYAATYRFARWLAVDRLAVTRGVVAVYQVGSVVDPPTWGRSDIDLVVVVDDPDGVIAARVVELLRFLHTWLPMLESPERAGVFRLSTLHEELDASPFLQWRLGHHRHKLLLWGRDVLADVPLTASPVELARAELGWWWRQVWDRWIEGRGHADGYVLHKLVAGAWRAVHYARTGVVVEPRADVLGLADLADALPPALLGSARAQAPVGPADAWAALHRMTLALAGPSPAVTPEAEDPALDATLRQRGARLARLGPDRRPDAPGEAQERLVEVDAPGPHVLRGLRLPGARLALLRDGVRWPVRPLEPPEWPGVRPERFGETAPPDREAQIAAARARALAEAEELVRTGAVFALDGPALVQLARAVGDLVHGDPDALCAPRPDPPDDLPLAEHQALTRAVSAALGVTWAPPAPLRLSVIIITRNRAELLRRALEALRHQRRPPDEVVVVNNGSSDHTAQVIAEAAEHLPVRAVDEPTPGIPRARNAGARAATGDVLCYTDDDATADPGWLEALEDRFQRDPRIGLVGGETLPDDQQPGLIARFFQEYMGSEVSP